MIKLFRKIRYELMGKPTYSEASTGTKTGKYLKYAAGEIILVVIGILIALQINNWNENRKNQKLIASYKNSLIENLVQDSIVIADRINSIQSNILEIEAFEKRVSKAQKPLDTILKIARFEYKFFISQSDHYEQDTYQVLNSTGHIALFDNTLIKKLKELNSLQDRALANNFHTFESYRNVGMSYARKYPFSLGNNLIKKNTKAASEVWNSISKSEHATEFNALVIAKGDSYRLALQFLPKLSIKTNELLALLRKN